MDNEYFLERLAELQYERRELSDAKIAKLLGVTKQFLSSVKNRKKDIPLKMRIDILNFLGYDWTRDGILSILPSELAEKIRRADLARISARLVDDQEN